MEEIRKPQFTDEFRDDITGGELFLGMPVKIMIPSPIRRLAGGNDCVLVKAGTVRDVLCSLKEAYPGFKGKLTDQNGSLKVSIKLLLNGHDVMSLSGLDTQVKDGDVLSIILAAFGG